MSERTQKLGKLFKEVSYTSNSRLFAEEEETHPCPTLSGSSGEGSQERAEARVQRDPLLKNSPAPARSVVCYYKITSEKHLTFLEHALLYGYSEIKKFQTGIV